jgi:hypothetical protein
MRAVIRGGLVLALLPAALAAQGSASGTHELGIDLTYVYAKPDGGESSWAAGAPVDIRCGIGVDKRLMWEGRFSFQAGGSNGSSSFDSGIGLAGIWAKNQRSGLYFLGGGGLAIAAQTDEKTGLAPSLVGGVGTRLPHGPAAIRLEAFGRYVFESSNDAPSSTRFGVRAGLSFWH